MSNELTIQCAMYGHDYTCPVDGGYICARCGAGPVIIEEKPPDFLEVSALRLHAALVARVMFSKRHSE